MGYDPYKTIIGYVNELEPLNEFKKGLKFNKITNKYIPIEIKEYEKELDPSNSPDVIKSKVHNAFKRVIKNGEELAEFNNKRNKAGSVYKVEYWLVCSKKIKELYKKGIEPERIDELNYAMFKIAPSNFKSMFEKGENLVNES